MTNAERFLGSLYETRGQVLFLIRAIDPRPDLAAALKAARRPGTPTKVRRGWSIEGGQLRLWFEVLEPKPCGRRAYYVPAAGLDAFVAGCAVGIDTKLSGRRHPADADLLPVWAAEAPRLDVLEAMTEGLLNRSMAFDASPWPVSFGARGGIERLTTPEVAMRKPTSHPAQTWRKLPKSPLKADFCRPMPQAPR
jgi:hypothetical protein